MGLKLSLESKWITFCNRWKTPRPFSTVQVVLNDNYTKFLKMLGSKKTIFVKFITKQGNRGDVRKIYVTWQFFVASGRHGDFFEKTKNPFLDKVNGSMCAKFQVCIVFRFARRRETNTYINTHRFFFILTLQCLELFWLAKFVQVCWKNSKIHLKVDLVESIERSFIIRVKAFLGF